MEGSWRGRCELRLPGQNPPPGGRWCRCRPPQRQPEPVQRTAGAGLPEAAERQSRGRAEALRLTPCGAPEVCTTRGVFQGTSLATTGGTDPIRSDEPVSWRRDRTGQRPSTRSLVNGQGSALGYHRSRPASEEQKTFTALAAIPRNGHRCVDGQAGRPTQTLTPLSGHTDVATARNPAVSRRHVRCSRPPTSDRPSAATTSNDNRDGCAGLAHTFRASSTPPQRANSWSKQTVRTSTVRPQAAAQR